MSFGALRKSVRRRFKLVKRFFVYVVLRGLILFLRFLPLSLSLFLGRVGGRLACLFSVRARRRSECQMQEALGVSSPESKILTREMFGNLGEVGVEVACLPKIRKRFESYVEISPQDQAKVEEVMAEGRGLIYVCGHIGNWELLGQRFMAAGFLGLTLARASSNPFFGRWLVAQRAAGGLQTVNRGEPRAARKILSALRKGAIVGALIDQATRVPSVLVPFFGRVAQTPVAPVELALRRRIPLVVGWCTRRVDRPGYRIHLSWPKVPVRTGRPTDQEVTDVTAGLNQILETAIREAPTGWVWFHERWKL